MKFRLAVAFISLAAIVSPLRAQNSAPSAASTTRAITAKDLFDFIWVTSPQLSPDGARVAFTRVNVDDKRTGYETSIWMAPTSGSEPALRMTNGKHDAQPRWSPDGKRIAFVRTGDKDETGKPKPSQIAVLSLSGGEAWIITDLPKGASNPVWSPDSKRIAFLSSTSSEDIEKVRRSKDMKSKETRKSEATKDSAELKQPEQDNEHESDIHIISRAVYRSNDAGYLDPKRHEHIWILEVPTTSDEPTKPAQLTSGNFDEGAPIWNPDSSRIYFLPSASTSPTTTYRPRIFTLFLHKVAAPKNSPRFPWESTTWPSARMAASLPFTDRSPSRFAPILSPISGSWMRLLTPNRKI